MTNYSEQNGCHNCKYHYGIAAKQGVDYHCSYGADHHWGKPMEAFVLWLNSAEHEEWAKAHVAQPFGICDDYEGEK